MRHAVSSWCNQQFAVEDKVNWIAATLDTDLSSASKVIHERKWEKILHRAVDAEKLDAIRISRLPVIAILKPDGTVAIMAGAHAVDVESEVARLLKKK